MSQKKSIAILHLDLGIGGAESLVVSIALALKSKGHSIKIFTAHCDPSHAFEPVKDGTLDVTVVGRYIPRVIFGRFTVLLAVFRMLVICMYLFYLKMVHGIVFDVIFNDQVSAINPIIHYVLAGEKSIFYCHYPDAFLCTDRASWLKRLYRSPFDKLEAWTTCSVSVVLVNSLFTAGVIKRFVPSAVPLVLYPPCGETPGSERILGVQEFPGLWNAETADGSAKLGSFDKFFLSLNRYERKKSIGVALEAFSAIKALGKTCLVIAGGYDPRVEENREHFAELMDFSMRLQIADRVVFLRSIKDLERKALMTQAIAVVYTPSGEHFGIVPCEAMALGTPVVACNDGGPKESIINGETGWLCEDVPFVQSFAFAMEKATRLSSRERHRIAEQCKRRVAENFSLETFACQLNEIVVMRLSDSPDKD